MAISRDLKVRFSHLDSAGVVFFARYFSLAHDLFEDFLEHAGFAWEEWFANPGFVAPFRHVEAEYFTPLRGGETCRAAFRATKLGGSSVAFACSLVRGETPVAELRLVVVFVSRRSGRKVAVPPSIRKKLAASLDVVAQPPRIRRRSSARRAFPSSDRGIVSKK